MTPKKFKECNVVFAENQDEYENLPAFKNNTQGGEVITCWNLNFKERLRILYKGELWLNMLTFNKPLTPVYLTTNKNDIFEKKNKSFLTKIKEFINKPYSFKRKQ